jgi:hypothetical protein
MKTEIKTNFHKLIDKIDNPDLLENFFGAMSYYVNKKKGEDITDELSPKQHKRLSDSIKQAEKGKTISNTEMKKEMKQWLTK